jgi:hypothetical protein
MLGINQNITISQQNKKPPRASARGVFFLPILKGSNFAFNGFYLFGGGIIPTRSQTRDRTQHFKRERATATRARARHVPQARKNATQGTKTRNPYQLHPRTAQRPPRAKNHGFTAHGLKARNGSRTRRTVGGLARSRNAQTAHQTQTASGAGQERQPKTPRGATVLSTSL